MQKFELTRNQILKIYKDRNWLIFEPDLHRAEVTAHEAQRELFKWQEGACDEHFDSLIPRVDCPHCQLLMRKHFGLYKEG
ncbi:hypothetical protein LCGC14_2570230 [marine sediment metagenome]|uniref:Uncharacterized protein n=1 Tax=marine sediment metagenome TaxID=412755 RepID=A0A0F9B5B4_9ZZZZ